MCRYSVSFGNDLKSSIGRPSIPGALLLGEVDTALYRFLRERGVLSIVFDLLGRGRGGGREESSVGGEVGSAV